MQALDAAAFGGSGIVVGGAGGDLLMPTIAQFQRLPQHQQHQHPTSSNNMMNAAFPDAMAYAPHQQQIQSTLSPNLPQVPLTHPTSSTPLTRTKSSPASDDRGRTPSPSSSSKGEDRVAKRKRNTEAARRYRQRKVDRVTELEDALAEVSRERDELKLKLARAEAEADVLRGMVRKG
jgi:hypothetical protein